MACNTPHIIAPGTDSGLDLCDCTEQHFWSTKGGNDAKEWLHLLFRDRKGTMTLTFRLRSGRMYRENNRIAHHSGSDSTIGPVLGGPLEPNRTELNCPIRDRATKGQKSLYFQSGTVLFLLSSRCNYQGLHDVKLILVIPGLFRFAQLFLKLSSEKVTF